MPTLTLTASDEALAIARIAIGDFLHLGRDATPQEIRAYMRDHLKRIIREYQVREVRAVLDAQAEAMVSEVEIT